MSSSTARRLGELLGLRVAHADGSIAGRVQDVRFTRASQGERRLVIVGVIVSQRAVGSLLGYDRDRTGGPWLLRILIRKLHRNALYVPWDKIADINWEEGLVRVEPHEFQRLRDLHG